MYAQNVKEKGHIYSAVEQLSGPSNKKEDTSSTERTLSNIIASISSDPTNPSKSPGYAGTQNHRENRPREKRKKKKIQKVEFDFTPAPGISARDRLPSRCTTADMEPNAEGYHYRRRAMAPARAVRATAGTLRWRGTAAELLNGLLAALAAPTGATDTDGLAASELEP